MFQIFEFLAIPLGWILNLVYQLVGNYFVAIFLFTLRTIPRLIVGRVE